MTTKMADDAATEQAKKQYEEEKKVTEKVRADSAARLKGKPTPTQEENDLVALGAHILEHESDGSDPDTGMTPGGGTKHLEASQSRPQTYQTRQQTAHKAE
jgi:hypothetical protein